MLDIRLFRSEPDAVRAALEKRGEDGAVVDEILRIDTDRRARQTELESLKAEQNRLGPELARIKKTGGDASELLARLTEMKGRIKESEDGVRELDDAQEALLTRLPN